MERSAHDRLGHDHGARDRRCRGRRRLACLRSRAATEKAADRSPAAPRCPAHRVRCHIAHSPTGDDGGRAPLRPRMPSQHTSCLHGRGSPYLQSSRLSCRRGARIAGSARAFEWYRSGVLRTIAVWKVMAGRLFATAPPPRKGRVNRRFPAVPRAAGALRVAAIGSRVGAGHGTGD
jgi:hypothetical protein